MIQYKTGNILNEHTDALVNTVNCVGVMGKGIALQFKRAYRENFNAYAIACNDKRVKPGQMFVFETGQLVNPRYIINFPTKRHWRNNSRMDDIGAGLVALVAVVRQYNIRSIAIPPLGCGNGGLNWETVKLLIESAMGSLDNVRVVIYNPSKVIS